MSLGCKSRFDFGPGSEDSCSPASYVWFMRCLLTRHAIVLIDVEPWIVGVIYCCWASWNPLFLMVLLSKDRIFLLFELCLLVLI